MQRHSYSLVTRSATPATLDMFRFPPPRGRMGRWLLPYGMFTVAGGREVLFDRRYNPILQRMNGGPASPANPGEWVENIIAQRWFYTGRTPEAECRAAGLAALQAWGWGLPS